MDPHIWGSRHRIAMTDPIKMETYILMKPGIETATHQWKPTLGRPEKKKKDRRRRTKKQKNQAIMKKHVVKNKNRH